MKKIGCMLILVVISTFYSCSDDDATTTQMQNPSQNGFTFNSEFFTTDELFVTGNPGALSFLIIDDTSQFNTATRTFEGNPGQVISISVPFELDGQVDFERTFTDAIQIDDDGEITAVSFVAGLIRNVPSIVPILSGSPSTGDEIILIASSGEITISFDAETSVFTLDYTFTTNGGTITGSHESEFITVDD